MTIEEIRAAIAEMSADEIRAKLDAMDQNWEEVANDLDAPASEVKNFVHWRQELKDAAENEQSSTLKP